MAYQSLYRRYRPQEFSEIKGQDHVVRALQTAVREDKVGHAYLLHGPRGSGKTSTARVLAKALNCTDLGDDGEPCCVCESCESIQQGRSFDLQELDAASNNKVDDMRSLLERVNLTSPGRAKVYLLDEVHMLTAGAENALLKTLEEPPAHVTWVLATTEPHKVVQTIRSRCQVFELGLIGADIMTDHIRYVVTDAELEVDDEAIDHAVAAGGGSVRDTLTELEQIVAAGGTTELDSSTDAVLSALADHDRAAALSAVGDAVSRGRNPRTIGEMALAGLRDAFLTAMDDPPTRMSEHERARAADLASRMAPAAITRALETLGRALIDMRQAPDPKVDIEVALMRLCHPDEDRSLEALAQRVQQLEARLDGSVASVPAASSPTAARSEPPAPPAHPAEAPASSGVAAARRALSEQRAAAPAAPSAPPLAPVSAGGPAAAARRALSEHRAAAPAAPSGSTVAPAVASDPVASPPPVPVPDPASMRPRSPTEVVDLARRYLGLERAFVVARAVDLEPDRERRREPAQLHALWRDLLEHAARVSPEPDSPAIEPPADAPEPASSVSGPPDDALEPPASEPLPSVDQASVAESPLDMAPAMEQPVEPDPATELLAEPDSGTNWEARATPTDPVVDWSAIPIGPSRSTEDAATPAQLEDEEYDGFDLTDLHDLAEAPSHAHDIEQKIKATFPGAELTLLPDPEDDEDGGEAQGPSG